MLRLVRCGAGANTNSISFHQIKKVQFIPKSTIQPFEMSLHPKTVTNYSACGSCNQLIL